jgi:hypothetical protein
MTPRLVNSLTLAHSSAVGTENAGHHSRADKRGDFHAREMAKAPKGPERSIKAKRFYGREIFKCRTLLTRRIKRAKNLL